MWQNNKQFVLIDTIDEYINDAEGDLDYIKSILIEYLNAKNFDINNTSLKKSDIYGFLDWYELSEYATDKLSLIRCKQVINFIFYNKLSD